MDVCVALNKGSCPNPVELYVSAQEFNVTEILDHAGSRSVYVTFVDRPTSPIMVFDSISRQKITLTCVGNAANDGVDVNFTGTEDIEMDIGNIVFTNFTGTFLFEPGAPVKFSTVTFDHCTFNASASEFNIDAYMVTIDIESLLTLDRAGLINVDCNIFLANVERLQQETAKVTVRFKEDAECLFDIGYVNGDSVMTFGNNHADVDIGGLRIHVMWRIIQGLTAGGILSGNCTIKSELNLDVGAFSPPLWWLTMKDGGIIALGDWPKGIKPFINVDLIGDIEVTLGGMNIPMDISNEGYINLSVTLNQIVARASITGVLEDIPYVFVEGSGVLECMLDNDHIPMSEFNVICTDDFVVKISGQFGNGTHLFTGNCTFEAVSMRLSPFAVVNISNLFISSLDLITVEFTFPNESDVHAACGFLHIEFFGYEDDDSLLSFMLHPVLNDLPNYHQMIELKNGFGFVETQVPVRRMDFQTAETKMRWFTKETSLLFLSKAGNDSVVKVRILDLPNEYPEFYCIDDEPKSEKCIGQQQISEDQVRDLPSLLRKSSTELRLSIYRNLSETLELNLSLFSPRVVKLSSDMYSRVQITDEHLSRVEFSGLRLHFSHRNVTAVAVEFVNCQIQGSVDFSANSLVTVDPDTLQGSAALTFRDAHLALGSETNVSIAVSSAAVVIEASPDVYCVVTKDVVAGRLTIQTPCNDLVLRLLYNERNNLFPVDLDLSSECLILCDDLDEVKFRDRPMKICHGNNTLRILGAHYFPAVLSGDGHVIFQASSVVLTEKQTISETWIVYLPMVSSTFYIRNCAIELGAELFVRSLDSNKPVEANIGNLTIDGHLVTDVLHVIGSITMDEGAELECTNLKLDSPLTLGNGSIVAYDVICPQVMIGEGCVLQANFATVSGDVTLSGGLIYIYKELKIGGNLHTHFSDILTDKLSVYGDLIIDYCVVAASILSAKAWVQMPRAINFRYTATTPENYSAFLDAWNIVLVVPSSCSPGIPVNFISDNWYFRDPDSVMSYKCTNDSTIYIALSRLPQPRPTRHISLVSQDIIMLVLLGGSAISAIVVVTGIFVVRFIRDPLMLEERFAPVNTALL